MTERLNHEAVYRTTPATPGLLKMCQIRCIKRYLRYDSGGKNDLGGPSRFYGLALLSLYRVIQRR